MLTSILFWNNLSQLLDGLRLPQIVKGEVYYPTSHFVKYFISMLQRKISIKQDVFPLKGGHNSMYTFASESYI